MRPMSIFELTSAPRRNCGFKILKAAAAAPAPAMNWRRLIPGLANSFLVFMVVMTASGLLRLAAAEELLDVTIQIHQAAGTGGVLNAIHHLRRPSFFFHLLADERVH